MPAATPIRLFAASLCACLAAPVALAEEAKKTPEGPRCSVVTVAPGDSLDALFGHTAIRIRDERLTPIFGAGDVWFDYGVFDMSDWTFWIHYAKGDAKYMLVAADPQRRLDIYKGQGRGVVEQQLDLTAEEAQKLEDFLIEDLRFGCGKNGYVYRFLDDNCTTRAKEAIEGATGKQITPAITGSYRNYTDLYLSRQPLAQLGANWLMGRHAERTTQVFLPSQLHMALKDVKPKKENHSSPHDAIRLPPTLGDRIKLSFLKLSAAISPLSLIFGGCFLCLAIPTLLRWKKRKPLPSRGWLDALLFAKFGLVGCLMTFLGFWSHHPELGAFNWNLIWCWPTHLIFAVFLLFAAHSPTARTYARVAAVGAICAALAYCFVPQALPLPLFPLVLLLGLRAARWGWPPAAATRTEP